ncbi:unnamed protein product [Paramecium pentaurelia]|uniref:Uncharacterized protein n=1 Tax=Paramecium pentaurelia TaxID=43138 RepID=A0A8S1VSV7_9CILI|nr:unnamed protein product [Paramecium pentaurelia]
MIYNNIIIFVIQQMHKQLNSISFLSANSGFSDLQSCSIIKGNNYYIAKSIDQHPELIQQLFETEKLQKTKNIFQDPVNLKILQHDPAIGPKYEKNKIVSRSIVGKPDIFRKKQPIQNNHSNQDFHMPTQQINMQESISLAKKESPLQRRLTQLKIAQSPVKISKQTKNENIITGSELISKIAQLEKRLIQNKLDEQEQLDNMPFIQKQNLYRDQRALEDFDKQEKIHSELLLSLSARVSRNPSCSVMMDLYNFRRKQEYSSTNDKMRQLSENKNQEIIEMQEQNQIPFFICSDRQQIIRKPHIFEKDATISNILKHMNEDKTFQSFTTNNFLKEKEQKYKLLAKDKIKLNIDELMVVGQSKYEQEISIDPSHKYVIKEIEKHQGNEEEIL